MDDRHESRSWWRTNWMAFVMFVAVMLATIWNGTNWLHARESSESNLAGEVKELRLELVEGRTTYVRQDVFTQVLVRIEQHLSDIDKRLAAKGK